MEIIHSGIRGMRWGVRHMRGPDGKTINRQEVNNRLPYVSKAVLKTSASKPGSKEEQNSFDTIVSALAGNKKIKDLSKTEMEQGELIALRLLDRDNIDLERYSISLTKNKKFATRYLDTTNPLQSAAVKKIAK